MVLMQAFFFSLLLTALKLLAFISTGSLVVLASFYDSATDSLVSYLNYVFYQKAREKADRKHPFGHGGFEVLSSLIQGIMISSLSLLLAYQSLQRLLYPQQGPDLKTEHIPLTIGVLIFSAISGFGIQWLLGKQERKLAQQGRLSLTVSSDRAHYLSDFLSNAFGALGLWSLYTFHWYWLDAALGLLAALFLMKVAWPLVKVTLSHIMHVEAEPEVHDAIASSVLQASPQIKGYHRLRTRRLGPNLFIDLHVKMPASLSLEKAHALGDLVEQAIKAKFPEADVLIHLDPDSLPDESIED